MRSSDPGQEFRDQLLLVSTVHRGGAAAVKNRVYAAARREQCRAVGSLRQVVHGDRQAGDGGKTLEVQRRLFGRPTEKTVRHVHVRRRCDARVADRMRDIADQRHLRAAVRASRAQATSTAYPTTP